MKKSSPPPKGRMRILRRPPERSLIARNPLNTSKPWMNASSRCGRISRQRPRSDSSPTATSIRRKLGAFQLVRMIQRAVEVLGVVEMIALARQEHLELRPDSRRRRSAIRSATVLRAWMTTYLSSLVLATSGVEARVVLLVDDGIVLRVRPDHVLSDLVAQQRLGMLLDVEHRAVVGRPRDRRLPTFGIRSGSVAPVDEILEANRPLAPADVVLRVGEDPAVRADLERADLEELEALGERVDVQHHLLGARASRPCGRESGTPGRSRSGV